LLILLWLVLKELSNVHSYNELTITARR